jgi:hypothetical protein
MIAEQMQKLLLSWPQHQFVRRLHLQNLNPKECMIKSSVRGVPARGRPWL